MATGSSISGLWLLPLLLTLGVPKEPANSQKAINVSGFRHDAPPPPIRKRMGKLRRDRKEWVKRCLAHRLRGVYKWVLNGLVEFALMSVKRTRNPKIKPESVV